MLLVWETNYIKKWVDFTRIGKIAEIFPIYWKYTLTHCLIYGAQKWVLSLNYPRLRSYCFHRWLHRNCMMFWNLLKTMCFNPYRQGRFSIDQLLQKYCLLLYSKDGYQTSHLTLLVLWNRYVQNVIKYGVEVC